MLFRTRVYSSFGRESLKRSPPSLPRPSKIPSPLAPKEGLITVINGGNLGTSWTQYPSKNPIEASKKKRPSKLDRLYRVFAEKTSHFL